MLVIKVGGGQGISYEKVCSDLAELHVKKHPWLLVHGGSNETNVLATWPPTTIRDLGVWV